MKLTQLNFALAAMLSSALFFACDNHQENKADEANKEAVQAENEARDADMQNERANYKAAQLEKIASNEERIAKLKEKKKESGKNMDKILQDRIDALEKRNAELKAKINNYDDNDRDNTKWGEFKREFNHDMDELGKSFEDMGEDNVK